MITIWILGWLFCFGMWLEADSLENTEEKAESGLKVFVFCVLVFAWTIFLGSAVYNRFFHGKMTGGRDEPDKEDDG